MRTAKYGFRGTKDETVKLGETDTGGQVSVTQVRPKHFIGTKFQSRRRKKRSRIKWKEKNNPKEDSSRSDGGDTGRTRSVVTTSSPVPQVKVKSMASMMIQGQVEGTPVQ
jgi:hypothetical protein